MVFGLAFAVVDVETTGMNATGDDRITEIAVVVGGLVGPLVGLAMPGDRSAAETPESLAADSAAAGHDPGIGVAP